MPERICLLWRHHAIKALLELALLLHRGAQRGRQLLHLVLELEDLLAQLLTLVLRRLDFRLEHATPALRGCFGHAERHELLTGNRLSAAAAARGARKCSPQRDHLVLCLGALFLSECQRRRQPRGVAGNAFLRGRVGHKFAQGFAKLLVLLRCGQDVVLKRLEL